MEINKEDLIRLIEDYPSVIRYIKNPPKEVQIKVIESDPYAIQHIKDPLPEVQSLALKAIVGDAWLYVKP